MNTEIVNIICVAISAVVTVLTLIHAWYQFWNHERPHIVPHFKMLEGHLYCLVFTNYGNSMAKNVSIDISEKWLSCYKNVKNASAIADRLRKLKDHQLFIAAYDDLFYEICVVNNGKDALNQLSKEPLVITISYSGPKGFIRYKERFNYDLSAFGGSLSNTSNFLRIADTHKKQLSQINNTLSDLSHVLSKQ